MSEPSSSNPILLRWQSTLKKRGDAPAIWDDLGQLLRSFADIERESVCCGESLAQFPKGTVLGIQTGANPTFPALLLATWRQGLIPLLLDSSLSAYARDEVLATCNAIGLAILGSDSEVRLVVRAKASPDALLANIHLLKITSGTTGKTRAIRFHGDQILADCAAICDTMGLTENDINYGAIAWAHSYGFSNLITPLLCRGIALVATEDRLPRAVINGLKNTEATVFPGVPVFFQKLAELNPGPLPKLRLCISAGAPIQQTVTQQFAQQYGLKIHNFYGSSECGGIAYDRTDALDLPEGAVGQAMLGVTIHQNENRIAVESRAVGEGYFPDDSSPTLANGRFTPGDLIECIPQGLRIIGRLSDFINVGGRKLNPADVEAQLRTCPDIRDCVVFGVASPKRGEEPVACVVAKTHASELINQFCRETFPAWQIPRAIWIVDSLPINARGKLSRVDLAKAYEAQR